MCGADLQAAPRSLEVLTPRRPLPWLPIVLAAVAVVAVLGAIALLAARGFGAAPAATVVAVTTVPPSATAASVVTNTATFTPVPTRAATATYTPTPPATPTIPPPIQYTVEEGDTLLALAQRFDVSVEAIRAANPGLEGDFIVAGQKLVIPRPTPGPTAAPGETLTPTAPAVVTVEHTVQAGETLSDIAQFYGVSVADIKAANPDLEDDIVIAGQTLTIPLGTPTPPPSSTPGPTSTSTPRPQYEAPALLNPPDNAAYVLAPDAAAGEYPADETIMLQWASVGLLAMRPPDATNEWYQVTLLDTTTGGDPRLYYIRATSLRISPDLRASLPPGSVHVFTWQVQVVREVSQGPDGTPRVVVPNGRASRVRTFRLAGPPEGTAIP